MSFWQLISLAITQGITEFLPVSSSGHLNLLQSFLKITPSLSLDVFLNTATLLSVIIVFRHQVKDFFKNFSFIVIGSLPAAAIGLLFKDQIEDVFSKPQYLSIFFLITSLLLFSQKSIKNKNLRLTKRNALIIGLFQALALFPGVSRSAATLFAALILGLSVKNAFKFSFYLFIPASLGALLLNFNQTSVLTSLQALPGLTAFLITLITGIISLNLLRRLLISRHLWFFGFYTTAISIIIAILTPA